MRETSNASNLGMDVEWFAGMLAATGLEFDRHTRNEFGGRLWLRSFCQRRRTRDLEGKIKGFVIASLISFSVS